MVVEVARYDERKTPISYEVLAFRCLISRPKNLIMRSRNQDQGKLLLSRKLVTFEGAVSRNVSRNVLYQQFPITRYKVRFYANIYQ